MCYAVTWGHHQWWPGGVMMYDDSGTEGGVSGVCARAVMRAAMQSGQQCASSGFGLLATLRSVKG